MADTGNIKQKGTILVVNTGSITTKFAVYVDGACVLEEKLLILPFIHQDLRKSMFHY